MVDYNLIDPRIIEALQNIGAVDVKTIIECGFDQHTKDADLIRGTSEHRRLLLTGDKRSINESSYKPCEHGGIIIIKDPRPTPEKVYARVKAFSQSGQRSLAKHHVMHLKESGAVIFTHHPDPIEVVFK